MPEITPLALEIWMERAKAAEARIAVLEKALRPFAEQHVFTSGCHVGIVLPADCHHCGPILRARSALAQPGTPPALPSRSRFVDKPSPG